MEAISLHLILVPVLITIIIVIVIVVLADLGSYAHHHRYRHCYSYRLILVPLCSLLQMLCSTSGVPFPSPHCPMSSVNANSIPLLEYSNNQRLSTVCVPVQHFGKRLTKSRLHKPNAVVCLVQIHGPGKARMVKKPFFALLHFSGSPQR